MVDKLYHSTPETDYIDVMYRVSPQKGSGDCNMSLLGEGGRDKQPIEGGPYCVVVN